MRPATLIRLAILGLTSLLVVFVNDHPSERARGAPLYESDGLAVLAVSALLVVVLATLSGRRSWLGYMLVPLTLGVGMVAYIIGTARFD